MSSVLPVRFADLAEDDLAESWRYVAVHSVEQADRMLERIVEQCERLGRWPGTGRPRPELHAEARGLVAVNHLILYRVDKKGVEIMRVIYAARDLSEVIGRKR